jgi:hypothetical protein
VQGRTLDNGQHILLGAYKRNPAPAETTGVDPRQPCCACRCRCAIPPGTGAWISSRPRLPAPLHLASRCCAQGPGTRRQAGLARFSTAARWMGWRLNRRAASAELLARFDQTRA